VSRSYQKLPRRVKSDRLLGRLNALEKIKERLIHTEKLTGEDKTVDVVVDIFNEINSGGTKLSKGDLALAKLCAVRPQTRNEMLALLNGWRKQGFSFELEWLLRCVTAVLTRKASFESLKDVSPDDFAAGLGQAGALVDKLLNLISGRLGLDHDRVLAGRYALSVMCCYLEQAGGKLVDKKAQDRLLYWYVHSFMWGRYAGSTETVLNQDLMALNAGAASYEQLVRQLRLIRGDLAVRAEDFGGWSVGARFYPMLYLLTRVLGAQDWCTGLSLNAHMLGRQQAAHPPYLSHGATLQGESRAARRERRCQFLLPDRRDEPGAW